MTDELMVQVTAFADAASAGDPGTPVPTCPDWSLRDLARHLGRVHRRVAETISGAGDRLIPHDQVADPEPPVAPDEVATWLLAGGAQVVSAVTSAEPERRVAGFSGPARVSWWARRMLHETVVHRYDAEVTVGIEPWVGVGPDLAADGLAESLSLLDTFGERRAALAGSGETIHVHALDEASCEWLITRGAGGVVVEQRHAKADVAVRGPAAALFAVLTNRCSVDAVPGGLGTVEVLGDGAVLRDWLRVSGL
ncbi:maleylpyruvate isomerase family mycothiol-dependent enzyme [Actinomycetospora endophytica]|uniref:Maleylpyruvate isomerase family mycothiol-dependent enzyme n=1 Tax=Actinomycetospora endophytica TaxID=2291215 RepID=A0ABS8P411_9PSEU|nr:maleylpyruvate isomerase family mycothiol-dependent enzyme [Actinomycetospora endophytica]MCD2192991.1 maleylpyruvate isomerase family mycothiol-dependent enzyme [Actinomycetospora endophytica]